MLYFFTIFPEYCVITLYVVIILEYFSLFHKKKRMIQGVYMTNLILKHTKIRHKSQLNYSFFWILSFNRRVFYNGDRRKYCNSIPPDTAILPCSWFYPRKHSMFSPYRARSHHCLRHSNDFAKFATPVIQTQSLRAPVSHFFRLCYRLTVKSKRS